VLIIYIRKKRKDEKIMDDNTKEVANPKWISIERKVARVYCLSRYIGSVAIT